MNNKFRIARVLAAVIAPAIYLLRIQSVDAIADLNGMPALAETAFSVLLLIVVLLAALSGGIALLKMLKAYEAMKPLEVSVFALAIGFAALSATIVRW